MMRAVGPGWCVMPALETRAQSARSTSIERPPQTTRQQLLAHMICDDDDDGVDGILWLSSSNGEWSPCRWRYGDDDRLTARALRERASLSKRVGWVFGWVHKSWQCRAALVAFRNNSLGARHFHLRIPCTSNAEHNKSSLPRRSSFSCARTLRAPTNWWRVSL